MKLFSFYDEQASFFLPPFAAANSTLVSRTLAQMVAEKADLPYVMYPRSFTLFELASFDELSGIITRYDLPLRHESVEALVAAVNAAFAQSST